MRRSGLSTLGGATVLLGVLAACVAAAVAVLGREPWQIRAIALTAAVTGTGAIGGWLAARLGRGKAPGLAVAGGLGATLVRLFPVLIALGWVTSREEGMGADRAGELLVFFYLLLLACDVVLNMIGTSRTRPGRSSMTEN